LNRKLGVLGHGQLQGTAARRAANNGCSKHTIDRRMQATD